MVLMLLIPMRRVFRLGGDLSPIGTWSRREVLLTTGWLLLYAYVVEIFLGWYSGNHYERYLDLVQRPLGRMRSSTGRLSS